MVGKIDRLAFPERGAQYFSIVRANALALAGVTVVDVCNYTFPDFAEGVIRGYALSGLAVIQAILNPAIFGVKVKVNGIPFPTVLNTTGSPVVNSPVGAEIEVFYPIKGGDVLTVEITKPIINATMITYRFSGWFYMFDR